MSRQISKVPLRLRKKQINTKKLEIRGRAPQATLLKNIRRFATIAALQVRIGDVLVAFVIHIFLINMLKIQKNPSDFSELKKKYDEHLIHLIAQNAEKLRNQKR